MYRNILVPTDGSECSLAAACVAARLAARLQGSLTALYVTLEGVPGAFSGGAVYPSALLGSRYEAFLRKQADDALAAVAAEAARFAVKVTRVRRTARHPWRAILATARARDCDLIVMASHGRGGAPRLLLGSESAMVLAHARIPVLICPSF